MPALQESLHLTIAHRVMESPIGELTVVTQASDVVGLHFPHHWTRPDPATFGQADDTTAADVVSQMEEHFAGRRRTFDLRLRADGNEREQKVWALIDQVPYATA
jgi:methylated-DNA-[protein]-cysteine S-methyltransferase